MGLGEACPAIQECLGQPKGIVCIVSIGRSLYEHEDLLLLVLGNVPGMPHRGSACGRLRPDELLA